MADQEKQDQQEPMPPGLKPINVQDQASSTSAAPVVNGNVPAPAEAAQLNLKADLRREYVSGGGFGFLSSNFLKSLPRYIDDVERDFGIDLYERMLLDSKVGSSVNLLKLGVLGQGHKIVAKVSDPHQPGYDESQFLAEFVERNFARLDQPVDQLLWSLLDAVATGYKLAEKNYELVEEGQDKDRLCLKSIHVKPRRSTAFVVDAYYNVVAVLGLLPGIASGTVLNQSYIGPSAIVNPGSNGVDTSATQGNLPPNLLPRDKFVIFSFRPNDGDPRGTSLLRSAYDPWWIKQQAKREYVRYLALYAIPALIAVLPPGAEARVVTDALGNILPGPDGNPVYVTPEEVIMNALESFKNGSNMAFPNGTDVKPLQVVTNGEAFIAAFAFLNTEIAQAILSQDLASGSARFQTNAASNTHQDVLDLVIRHIKEALIKVIETDIIKQLIIVNFGYEAWEKYAPSFSLSEMEHQDFAVNLSAVAQAMRAGYFQDDQLPKLDAMLNLPVRDPELAALNQDDPAAADGEDDPADGSPGQGEGEGQENPDQPPQEESDPDADPQNDPPADGKKPAPNDKQAQPKQPTKPSK